MSENKEKNSRLASFITRTITGAILVAALTLVVILGKWAMAVSFFAALCLCIYEQFRAMRSAGHTVMEWPAYVGLALSGLLVVCEPTHLMLPVLYTISFLNIACIMRRAKPDLTDIMYSTLPAMGVVLPGMCVLGLLTVEPLSLCRFFVLMMVAIPLVGDVFAYLVGNVVGGAKLCPNISPNKTIAGAVGGLFGSILAGILTGWLFSVFLADPSVLPPMWMNALLGLVGGIAGQVGDLFASLIKRHCGVKDFGTIFPGHGGMMDRIDSVLFAAVIVFAFRCFFLNIL